MSYKIPNIQDINHIGLDAEIEKIRDVLNTQLGTWLNMYHVAYPRVSDGKTLPFIYSGYGKKDYYPVTPNDNMKGLGFFILDGGKEYKGEKNSRRGRIYQQQVRAIFWLNMAKVYPTFTGYAKEQAQRDIMQVFNMYLSGIVSIEVTGIEHIWQDVWSDFDISEQMRYFEFPYFTTSVNFNLIAYEICS